mmetsp:Transcript_57855/g.95970  ORF Transcript_57855/g.95970 Transcript_57855/m.95970 type:complete len:249 (+) Transcript_57855:169-915(+)
MQWTAYFLLLLPVYSIKPTDGGCLATLAHRIVIRKMGTRSGIAKISIAFLFEQLQIEAVPIQFIFLCEMFGVMQRDRMDDEQLVHHHERETIMPQCKCALDFVESSADEIIVPLILWHATHFGANNVPRLIRPAALAVFGVVEHIRCDTAVPSLIVRTSLCLHRGMKGCHCFALNQAQQRILVQCVEIDWRSIPSMHIRIIIIVRVSGRNPLLRLHFKSRNNKNRFLMRLVALCQLIECTLIEVQIVQ